MIRIDVLKEREKYLKKLIDSKKKALIKAPEGKLHGIKHGNGYQYFLRQNNADTNGKYLRKSEAKIVAKLGQKYYDERVLSNAEQELRAIERLIKIYENGVSEDVYNLIPESFRAIAKPIRESDEKFVENWKTIEYEKNDYFEENKIHTSLNHEKMRSKSEVMIANLLYKKGIPYLYEKPLTIGGKVIYPDFTLLDIESRQEIILEHFGMMDDLAYSDRAYQKIREYEENGYFQGDKLLTTFETRKLPLKIELVEKMIDNRFRK